MGAQPEQRQPRSATGLRKRLFGCQRLDKLEYSGPDERRIDSYRRCRQRFSMDQGGRRRPRRRCVVWLEPERRPQQPVWASLERLYVSSCICDRFDGAVGSGAPSVTLVKVSPHPMHYNDICLAGSGCIASQGNRNLADFFAVTIDHTGAAEIVYDDTSNGRRESCLSPTVEQTV